MKIGTRDEKGIRGRRAPVAVVATMGRGLGVSAGSVWLVASPSGRGVAVVCLEASDPDRALGELDASEAPFDSWYGGSMRKPFGFDLVRIARAGSSELLFTWRDYNGPGERWASKNT